MIEKLIAHTNALIASNPTLYAYLRYKRVTPGLPNPKNGYPQICLDYSDATPTGHKSGYSETMRAHLLLWHDTEAMQIVRASTMSTLLCALIKENPEHDGCYVSVVGREALGDTDGAVSRTRIQLDLRE